MNTAEVFRNVLNLLNLPQVPIPNKKECLDYVSLKLPNEYQMYCDGFADSIFSDVDTSRIPVLEHPLLTAARVIRDLNCSIIDDDDMQELKALYQVRDILLLGEMCYRAVSIMDSMWPLPTSTLFHSYKGN